MQAAANDNECGLAALYDSLTPAGRLADLTARVDDLVGQVGGCKNAAVLKEREDVVRHIQRSLTFFEIMPKSRPDYDPEAWVSRAECMLFALADAAGDSRRLEGYRQHCTIVALLSYALDLTGGVLLDPHVRGPLDGLTR